MSNFSRVLAPELVSTLLPAGSKRLGSLAHSVGFANAAKFPGSCGREGVRVSHTAQPCIPCCVFVFGFLMSRCALCSLALRKRSRTGHVGTLCKVWLGDAEKPGIHM